MYKRQDYGITSYNLGCERQNLITSYYWLKEALRCQSPKAVVLDSYFLFQYEEKDSQNLSEPYVRKALDLSLIHIFFWRVSWEH